MHGMTLCVALHSTHSYGYAFRSNAASNRPIPSPSSGILGAIYGLADRVIPPHG